MMTLAALKTEAGVQIINQVYWEKTNQNGQFRNGSRIEMQARNHVIFTNPLMAAGKVIMSWKSVGNYQAEKVVPSLPMLASDQQYRLLARLRTEPVATIIIRLNFFNRQGELIKQLNFTKLSNVFTFPKQAASYTIELINAGCIKVNFERLEIGPAKLKDDAFDDLWLQDPIVDNGQGQPVNLLIVGADKRAKRTYPDLSRLAGQLNTQILEVAWQFKGDLSSKIQQLLKGNHAYQTHLISTAPQFDHAVASVCQQMTSLAGLVTNEGYTGDFNLHYYHWQPNDSGVNQQVASPNWPVIFEAIHHLWGGQEHATR